MMAAFIPSYALFIILYVLEQRTVAEFNESETLEKSRLEPILFSKETASFYNSMVLENEAISSSYCGLNRTTMLDRSTYTYYLNAASEESYAFLNRKYEAQYFLGLMHLYNLVEKTNAYTNLKKATEYFRSAAIGDHANAQCALGIVLYHSQDDENKKAALTWFFRASTRNHPRAYWLLGKAVYDGWDFHTDPSNQRIVTSSIRQTDTPNASKAARYFRSSSSSGEHNVPEALHHLALLHEYHLIRPEEEDESEDEEGDEQWECHDESTENGFCADDSLHHRSSSLPPSSLEPLSAQERTENLKQALSLYLEAYDARPMAQTSYNIGLMHTYGRGTPQNFARATEWFHKGALLFDHPGSMKYLGLLAVNGYGMPHGMPNYEHALKWFQRCARLFPQEVWGQECKMERNRLGHALSDGKNKTKRFFKDISYQMLLKMNHTTSYDQYR